MTFDGYDACGFLNKMRAALAAGHDVHGVHRLRPSFVKRLQKS